jgi:hypothetical protein
LNATVNGPEIAISDARLEGAAVNAQLSGRLRESDIAVDWTLNLEDLSLITASLVGDLRAQGRLRGPWQTAGLDASAVGDIGTPRIARQPINVSVNAIGFPRSQSGNFSAQGRFDNAPFSLDGKLLRVEDGLKATVERGTWKSLTVRADVTIPENGDVGGTATLSLVRLNDIASVIDEPIEGEVQADIVFRIRDGETAADITARAQAVRYVDVTARDIEAKVHLAMGDDRSAATIEARAVEFALRDIAVRNATISGRIDQPFDAPSLVLAVNAPGLAVAQFVGDAKARIDGGTGAMNIRFDWAPRDNFGNAGQISATTRLDLSNLRILVSALQVKYRDESVLLEQPFTLAFGVETTLDRVLPYWNNRLAPELKAGRDVLVVAHGNSLRALVKMLDGMSEADIVEHTLTWPWSSVDHGSTTARRNVDAPFDQRVETDAVDERQLPCPFQHVAVAIRRPEVADSVLAEADPHTRST